MAKISMVLLLGAFLALFLSRYPGLVADGSLGVDESQMAAGALTVQARGALPWRDFDLTTIGPVTTWFLAGAAAVGVPPTYRGMHFLAALVWAMTGVLVLTMVHMACGTRGAVFAFALLLGVSLSAWRPDYLHFTSEALPAMLLAGAALLVVVPLTRSVGPRGAAVLAFFCGVLCALAVLAKLQAAPIAAVLCAAALLPSLRHGWGRVVGAGVAVAAGAVLPVAVLVVWLAVEGALSLAVQSYVLGGASYGASQSFGLRWLAKLARDLLLGWGIFPPIFIILLLVCTVLVYEGWKPWKADFRQFSLSILFAGWFASTLVAIILPSYRFQHHGMFLIAPATLLVTCLACDLARIGIARSSANSWSSWLQGRKPRGLILAILVLWFAIVSPWLVWSILGRELPEKAFPDSALVEICHVVDSSSAPGEPIMVWGWAPEIHVLTGRPSATRHVISHFLLDDNASRELHRQNLIADLQRSRPAVIVDAVAPGFFTWRWGPELAPFRADAFPELAEFLAENYREVARVTHEGAADKVIVYVRVDRD